MKLRVLGSYRNDARDIAYVPGTVIEVEPQLGAYLLADAPGCFEWYVEAKAPSGPPADKAVKSPPRRKGRP